ncbi:BON domain-containing protein [Filimonas lacunae]|nr:BON domain-containing protein [Filimonas lacunae]
MNKLAAIVGLMAFSVLTACKGTKSDAEIQAAVAEKIGPIPGVMADTKDGVVTLSGSVPEDSLRTSAETLTKSTEGVVSVVNSITIAPVAPVLPPPADTTALSTSTDTQIKSSVDMLIKEYPGTKASVKDGVITVTGELSAAKWTTLKTALDALKPISIDASGLTVKK